MTERVVDFHIRRPAVAVAVPMVEQQPRDAVISREVWLTAGDFRPGYDVYLVRDKVAVIHVTRNNIINDFLALPKHVQFLLMVDDDMVVPANLIDIWVGNENARLPFVSGYCTSKLWPFKPIPSKFLGMSNLYGKQAHTYTPITNWPVGSGLQECDGVGMAAVCIRRDVLEAMEPPYFDMEGGGGEDFFFCRKLRDLRLDGWTKGVPVVIDTNTPIGHVGSLVAYPEHWFASKENWMATTGRTEIDLMEAAAD